MPSKAPASVGVTKRRRALRRWRRPAHFAAIVVGSALLSWGAWSGGQPAWQGFDRLVWDFAFRARGPIDLNTIKDTPHLSHIYCVRSSHAIPRPLLARLVRKLRLARVVALDFMLVDNLAELQPGEKSLYQSDIARWKKDNAVLAAAIASPRHVLLAQWPEEVRPSGSPGASAPAQSAKLDSDFASAGQEWRTPPAVLTQAAYGLGHVVITEEGGVMRRARLWQETPRGRVPCLGLAMAALASGQEPDDFAAGKRWAQQQDGSVVVDWLGGREVFGDLDNSIDYEQALEWDEEEFRDKIVLVGEVSRQSKEIALTPWGEIPAMQAHATVAAMLLSPQGPPTILPSTWTLALCVLCAGLVLAPLWRRGLGLLGCFLSLAAQFALAIMGGAWLFGAHHILLPASAPLAAGILACNLLALYEYRRARHALGRLIGIGMISRALHPLATLEPGEGDSREEEATALFCDLRGYSTVSEELLPRETGELVNAYFTFLVRAIHRWGGRVIDYQGDAVFVVFEALSEKEARSSTWGPIQDAPRHATRAVRAALDITGGMRAFSVAWEPVVGRELSVGIGLQSGPMQIGLIGSTDRAHFGALGDTVNVAARIQDFSKTLPARIVIGEGTHAVLAAEGSLPLFQDAEVETVEFGPKPIRGRAREVKLWGVRHKADTARTSSQLTPSPIP